MASGTYEEQDSRGGRDRSDMAPRRMTPREEAIVVESVADDQDARKLLLQNNTSTSTEFY